jgi:hypothetical protein
MRDDRLTPAQVVLLAAVLAPGDKKKPPTRAEIRKRVGPLLASAMASPPEKNAAADAALDAAVDARWVEAQRLKGSASDRFALSGTGRELIGGFLAAADLKPGASWTKYRDDVLPPLALRAASGKADAGLKKFEALRTFLLLRALSVPYDSKTSPATALNRAVAQLLRTKSDKPAPIREAAVRAWILEGTEPSPPPPSPPVRNAPGQFALADFAADVNEAARSATSGRWGDRKAFISHIWQHMQQAGKTHGLDDVGFRTALLQANRSQLVQLARADLVQEMPAADVRASELKGPADTYHFVLVEQR